MKRIQLILAAIAAIAATIAGLDLTGFVAVLPPEMAKWLVIVPSGAAAIVHIAQTVKLELAKLEENSKDGFSDKMPAFGLLAVLAAVMFLPSCADTGYPLTGQISYRDPNSGAKGGLVFEQGKPPRASVRVPVYDPQTGELIGVGELSGPLSREVSPTK
jgi:hypothetical protein